MRHSKRLSPTFPAYEDGDVVNCVYFGIRVDMAGRRRWWSLIKGPHSPVTYTSALLSQTPGTMVPLLIFMLQALLVFTVSDAGSCFRIRLPNGRCHELLQRNYITRSECCRLGGFYVSGHLTEPQFVRDLLLRRTGIANCHYSCQRALDYFLGFHNESCARVNCPDGFRCEVQNHEAVCACSSICIVEDFESGPVCTTDFRQFRNRCSFLKERCRNLDTLLVEMECPPADHVCPYRQNTSHLEDHDYAYPVRICPPNKVCIVRQYSGRASCEDPNWLGRKHIESAFDRVTVSNLDSCANSPYGSPICGTDNNTYNNQCHLRKASIQKGLEIRVAYLGPCRKNATCDQIRCQSPHMTCVPHVRTGQPVCLDCTDLPPNCNPRVFVRINPAEIAEMTLFEMFKEAKQNFGDPRWHGDVFTNGWPRVCGSGRKSFPNACFLHVYNCIAKRFVDLVSTGYCPAE
ncbi:Follistatin-A [Echinococcus granulosus]|uniref:Follistatin-A n=1 Tax=Echinococcus granulosus TaxID=6210 RepID=W6UFA9_ECHGR|nr:Follistatin-A [Echinococcus granulosus]EUB56837.1 Follistatin-A [Echinococcus granulosus]